VSEHGLGRIARALRHRLGWRQADVARRAAVSQARVSTLERGQIDNLSVQMLRRILRVLDADLVLLVRWRGGELDRLLDEGHAALVGRIAALLEEWGWDTRLEVSFSIFGDRGSIDALAWHAPTATLLVVEIKTEITSVEETLRRHDVKCRLGGGLAAERFGWRARTIARLLVLPDTMTARRRVARHESVFSRAYPIRSDHLRRWLRTPESAAAGLLFAPGSRETTGIGNSLARKRVRRHAHARGDGGPGPNTAQIANRSRHATR
jgi:transcriptional regulator with XRE-family HTH domain